MRFRSSWLPTAAAAVLLCPGLALAQGTPTEQPITPGGGAPSTGVPGSRVPGTPGAFRTPLPLRAGEAISVLVFPFGFRAGDPAAAPAPDAGGAPGAAALSPSQRDTMNALTAQVKAGFLSTPAFSVASYHPQSSLIQRARKDDILRPDMVTDVIAADTGAVDVQKARTIAYRLGIQTLLVGTVDETYDRKTNNLELTLEAQLIDSTTGEVLRAAAVSGAASGAEGVPQQSLIEAASRDASQKVFPAMGIQLVPLRTESAPVAKGKSKPAVKKSDSSKKASREAEDAARQAKRAEEAMRKQAEEQAKQAERARRDSEKRGADSARGRSGDVKLAAATPVVVPVAQAQPVPATPPPAAPTPPATGSGNQVAPGLNSSRPAQGTSTASGDPIPYGYAVGNNKDVLPKRSRSGLRVPAWLGVAAFLAGVSFLL